MKNLTFLTLMLAITVQLMAQNAFGPINFGMTKKEYKEAIRNSDNMSLFGGQLNTNILGNKYFGTFVINENGGLVGIWLHHYRGNMAAYSRNYSAYNSTELENDISELITLLTEQYGEPIFNKGFKHPGETEINRAAVVGIWVTDTKHIRLIEKNINALTYPQIAIFEKAFMEKFGESLDELSEKEKQETKELFK